MDVVQQHHIRVDSEGVFERRAGERRQTSIGRNGVAIHDGAAAVSFTAVKQGVQALGLEEVLNWTQTALNRVDRTNNLAVGFLSGWSFVDPRLAFWLLPDAAIVHEPDLALDHSLTVFRVLHRFPFQIEVLGIDRLLVKYLVKLGAQVF
jgi:hypothetical protein